MLTKTPDLPPISRGPDRFRKQISEIDVASCTIEQLLAFRQQITAALPSRGLKDIDLTEELVIQVLALQQAQQAAVEDDDVPTNQRAQAMSALSAALTTLAKLQVETFTSERLKKAESLLIEVLQTLPTEAQEAFLERYARELGKLT